MRKKYQEELLELMRLFPNDDLSACDADGGVGLFTKPKFIKQNKSFVKVLIERNIITLDGLHKMELTLFESLFKYQKAVVKFHQKGILLNVINSPALEIFLKNGDYLFQLLNGDKERKINPIKLKTLLDLGNGSSSSLECILQYPDVIHDYMRGIPNAFECLHKMNWISLISLFQYENAVFSLHKKGITLSVLQNVSPFTLSTFLENSKGLFQLLNGNKEQRIEQFNELNTLEEKSPGTLRCVLKNPKAVQYYIKIIPKVLEKFHGMHRKKIKQLLESPNSENSQMWIADRLGQKAQPKPIERKQQR